ncbi:MAG TPA: methyltransferase domain-containing protein [Gemmatimonadaceae bacterium]|jgi:SAM-dependent methyltransferase
MLTPARRRGVEILDDPAIDPAIRQRSIHDVTRSNRWLGGLRAGLLGLVDAGRPAGAYTLLDVGTGLSDIPERARLAARRAGTALTTIGVDEAASLLAGTRGRLDFAVAANARALPFRDHSIDVVMCSQLLHHFEANDAEHVLAEMNRVARHAVVVSDLRRSWVAAAGFWVMSYVLRFHRVTRHDGVVSVLRGFTADELRRHVETATNTTPVVRHRLGFRLTAHWSPRVA